MRQYMQYACIFLLIKMGMVWAWFEFHHTCNPPFINPAYAPGVCVWGGEGGMHYVKQQHLDNV